MQFDPKHLDPALFTHYPHFLAEEVADRALDRCWLELEWSQRTIKLFGRQVMQPRLIAWYGDPQAVYCYSGLKLEPLPWHPLLLELKTHIEDLTGGRFNSVLANAYRNGRDSMGWHSDDERELGESPTIASVSLGAVRRFRLEHRSRADIAPSEWQLGHGSLIVRAGQPSGTGFRRPGARWANG